MLVAGGVPVHSTEVLAHETLLIFDNDVDGLYRHEVINITDKEGEYFILRYFC
eukprot:m.163217 g.163217  ORF g.163217 m.163217 type:complete len:53 (+) comp13414_c1_seq1:1660-1818(+)